MPQSGEYLLEVRLSNKAAGGVFHVEVGGVSTGAISVPNTGGWQNWTTVSRTMTLAGGVQILRLSLDAIASSEHVGTFNWLRLTSASVPSTPSNLNAVTVTGGIKLTWADNANNESNFVIERKTGVGGTFAPLATVGGNVTTYSDFTVAASTTYIYRVKATNAIGSSGYSNESTIAVPAAPTQDPYRGVPFQVGQLIEVEDFDLGGEGIAYHDIESSNLGGAYRSGSGVDIQPTSDSGGGYNIGWTKAGEWLEYTVEVPQSGEYLLEVRLSNKAAGGVFHVEVGGVSTGAISVPNTGGWQNWTTVSRTMTLAGGVQILRLSLDAIASSEHVGTFNWLRLTSASVPSTPSNLNAVTVTGGIKLTWADNANNESNFVIERKTGVGGTFAPLATVGGNVTTYSDFTVAASTTYIYRVKATNAIGSSGYSNESTIAVPAAPTQDPYRGVPFQVGQLIEVEDFDLGGEGIAYHDIESSNLGGAYRSGSGVDIQPTSDSGGGYNIGWTKAGEWLEYTVEVPQSGEYLLEVRLSNKAAGGVFHVEVGGVSTGAISVPNTGGWQNWTTVSRTMTLAGGVQILRLSLDAIASSEHVGTFNWLRLTSASVPSTPSNLTVATRPPTDASADDKDLPLVKLVGI